MKAKIVDKSTLKMTPIERQAESLLRRISADNAIEVNLDGTSARTVRRAFSKAAVNLGLAIQLREKDDTVYVILKPRKAPEQTEVEQAQ